MSSPFVWFHNNGNKPNETKVFLESLLNFQSSEGPGGMTMLATSAGPFAAVGSKEDRYGDRDEWVPFVAVEDVDAATKRAVGLGASLASFEGKLRGSPRAQLRWHAAEPLSLTLSYARLLQFAQSLRNPESVVSTVFPADLHVAAGGSGVPVAVGNQGSLAAEYRPTAGLRFAADAWARDLESIVMVRSRPPASGRRSGLGGVPGTRPGAHPPAQTTVRPLRTPPSTRATRNRTRNRKKRIFATPAEAAAIPPKPNTAATSATTKNTRAQYSIGSPPVESAVA